MSESTIKVSLPKKRITLDVLDDGRVTVAVERRGEEGALAFGLPADAAAELLEQLRVLWAIH
jgi:hypothetical protein